MSLRLTRRLGVRQSRRERGARLQRLRTIGIGTVALALIGFIIYAEFVRDWRTDQSDQPARFTVGVTYSLSLVNYNKLLAENKRRYGDRAETNMDFDTGTIQVILDGKAIETRAQDKTLNGVQGMFVIGTEDGVSARFPFNIEFRSDFSNPTRSLALFLKQHFKRAPREWFEFSDNDWTIDRCASLSNGFGLRFFGKALDLYEGTACVVTWKGQQPSSMLVSVGRADGDPWMRPFSRRLCRDIVDAALKRFNPGEPSSPKYAACILADRPAYVSAQKSLVVDVYSVDPHNRLARLDWRRASR
jgi:hypothetical protein